MVFLQRFDLGLLILFCMVIHHVHSNTHCIIGENCPRPNICVNSTDWIDFSTTERNVCGQYFSLCPKRNLILATGDMAHSACVSFEDFVDASLCFMESSQMMCNALNFKKGCYYEKKINTWFYRPTSSAKTLKFYIRNATSTNNRTTVVCTAIQESLRRRMELGNATVVINFTTNMPPEVLDFNLTELSASDDRCLGAVIVKVVVKANPCPGTFQWLLNNSRLSNGTEYSFNNPCDDSSASSPFLYTLTINDLTSGTSGYYSANFSNSAGDGSSPTVYISVPEPTSLSITGLNIKVFDYPSLSCLLNASTVLITCEAEGFPRPNIMFLKGPTPITPGNGAFTRYSLACSNQIKISSVVEEDAGNYTCMADEHVLSKTFQLCRKPEVLGFNLSTTVDRRLGSLIVKEVGSTLELPVYVKANPCPDTFQWLYNNSRLSNGTEYSFSDPCDDSSASSPFLYTLTITNLTSGTSGSYSANFLNSAGGGSSPTVYISVPVKPYILNSSTSGNTTIGEKLIMQCQIWGIPTPMVMWTKDHTPLVNQRDGSLIIVSIGDISKVEISSSKVNDSGKYTCTATNSAGSVSQEFVQEVRLSVGAIVGITIGAIAVFIIILIIIGIIIVAVVCLVKKRKKKDPGASVANNGSPGASVANNGQDISPGASVANNGQVISPGASVANNGQVISPGASVANNGQVISPGASVANNGQVISPGASVANNGQVISNRENLGANSDLELRAMS